MFLNHLYGGWTSRNSDLDVFICKLRKKLANASSGKLYRDGLGRGYVLREPIEGETRISA